MNGIRKIEDLYSQLQLPVSAVELVDAIWSDYVNTVATTERYHTDYDYSGHIFVPTPADFLDDDVSTYVPLLLNQLVGQITLGGGNVDVLINDDNIDGFSEVKTEMEAKFYKDLIKVAGHYHFSLCIDKSQKKYINMPMRPVW